MVRKLLFIALTLIINQTAFSEDIIHVFKKGDTLYSLSKKYNVPLNEIVELNNISDPMKIREGFKIVIKKENKIYTVKKGDTLYSIAKKHSLNIRKLLEVNKITEKSIIKVGQKIYLPVTIDSNGSQKVVIKKPSGNEAEIIKKNPKPAGNLKKKKNDFFWPVDGKIEKLKGKLQGSRISADKGDPVYSVSSGRVVWEGPYRGFGRVVFIESSGGYVYVYGGNEKTRVSVGDVVEPGSEIGMIGFNIHESKPGIYFSVYKNGEPVDVEKAPRL